jgi:hypothetical protein
MQISLQRDCDVGTTYSGDKTAIELFQGGITAWAIGSRSCLDDDRWLGQMPLKLDEFRSFDDEVECDA